ncbi:hypothetical protein B0H10DRAFT_2224367 [Mycena sp. CBHHK59/15]|nr:hypothetical protein B0H10DRAFT_2224367 [Mycena sp. CBHHK59/15]
MSHKWTANAISTLSDRAMEAIRAIIHIFPWVMSHDNLNVALRVFSQRLNNQSHFISRCAYTVWVLPLQAVLPPEMNWGFQIFWAENCSTVFDFSTVLYGNDAADDRMEAFDQHHILQVLLNSPEFSDYLDHTHPLFEAPPPVNHLQESSYEGTLNIMNDSFHQLLLNSTDEQQRTALKQIIAWIGDQFTIERLRRLWKYRHEDHNSFDRLDYMIPIFGWFHLVMAFANSIHKQYLGTSASIGSLRQAFEVLKWKGLISQSTKGLFWHNLDEALHHISEAHFHASWLDVRKVENLAELKSKSPEQLRKLDQSSFASSLRASFAPMPPEKG